MNELAVPVEWSPAKRGQKDVQPRVTKKHGKSYFGYKLSVSVGARHKLIRWVSDASKADTGIWWRCSTGTTAVGTSGRIAAITINLGAVAPDDWLATACPAQGPDRQAYRGAGQGTEQAHRQSA